MLGDGTRKIQVDTSKEFTLTKTNLIIKMRGVVKIEKSDNLWNI